MTDNGNALATIDTPPAVAPFSAEREVFEVAQRTAKALAASSIVPKDYQGNIANVMVAMEYANRLGASVLAVMQNLHIIHGRPSLGASFLIGTVNATGRFSPIRWKFVGQEGTDSWGAYAYAMDRETGEVCEGPRITIALAKKEGWYNKNGSKWQTAPELMLMYRAGAWWTRLYAPDLSLGLHTTDELEDAGLSAPVAQAQRAASALDAPEVIPEAEVVERIPGEDDDRDGHEGVVWMEGEKGLTDEERAKGWGSTSGDELALDDQPKKKSRSAVEQGR